MREPVLEQSATLSSDPVRLRKARRGIMRLVHEAGFTSQDAHELGVAFSEACANVHRHAYGGRRDGRVELRVVVEPERVIVTLTHDGTPFEPSFHAPPDLGQPSESGYGLYLIASLVDEVTFGKFGAGGRVILVKRKSPAHARV